MTKESMFSLWRNRCLTARAFMLNGEIEEAIRAKREQLYFEESLVTAFGRDAFVSLLSDEVNNYRR